MGNKLADEKVKVRLATCPKCDGIVFVGVEHMMDADGYKEIADCAKKGCNIITKPLLEYREENKEWCGCNKSNCN